MIVAGLMLAVSALAAAALEPVNQGRLSGVAIKGYDPVAYFADGKPSKGDKAFAFTWKNAIWRFASAEHRDRFAANPELYAPQYGGYCAYAVSEGETAPISPEIWQIVDGKLYLNYSRKVQDMWAKDCGERIRKADENWPRLLSE